jgi:GTP cyclohydrolase I
MVIERKSCSTSTCAHHFVPFHGHAHIAYIPQARIVGCRSCHGSSSSTPRGLSCKRG